MSYSTGFGPRSPGGGQMNPWEQGGMVGGAPAAGGMTSGLGGMNPWESGMAGGGGFALLSSMFGDDDDGGQGAGGYLGQISQMLPKYFEPYQEMLDPGKLMGKIGGGFKSSPGYQFSLGQALKGVGQASAAGGMAGSPMQQQQAAGAAQGLASQDYGNYMQRALGLYGQGAQGYRGLGEDLASALMSQSQLAQLQQEEAQRGQMQQSSDMWGALGSIGSAAMMM